MTCFCCEWRVFRKKDLE